MGLKQIVEKIEELVEGQVIEPAVKIVADPPDCPCVCLNGLGLQTCQFQALEMLAIIFVELRIIGFAGVHCNLLLEYLVNGQMHLHRLSWYSTIKTRRYNVVILKERWGCCLRVAASSNKVD